MNYYNSKIVKLNFEEAVQKVTEELQKEGFGVITEIDIKETLKKKLNIDFRKYKILGACNPSFAYQALQNEDKIGTLLPCNFIVQETENSTVEIAAVNPAVSMQNVKNPQLSGIAGEVSKKLAKVLSNI